METVWTNCVDHCRSITKRLVVTALFVKAPRGVARELYRNVVSVYRSTAETQHEASPAGCLEDLVSKHDSKAFKLTTVIYIYMAIDLKVLVRSFNCESRACYVGNPRESFFLSSRK